MADESQTTAEQKVEKETPEEDLCCIEASVVTGFEECARGEAKEKFGVAVQAARGKIVWKLPISRVKEVVKMGSIDNCRVLLHSVPHFKFTNDQHESLSRLQKMLPDMDWEKGLRVWNCFFDFPHPIASKPDVILSPEDLVDVVIIERTQFKDPNAKRHNKKGGRGKKKDRRKEKKNDDKDDKVETKTENKNVCNENQNATAEISAIIDHSAGDNDNTDKCKENSNNLLTEGEDVEKKDDAQEGTQLQERPSSQSEGRTSVFIKRPDPNRPEPKVEVKVLIPGPVEDAFPTHVDEADHRSVEPMDVDMSINMGSEPNVVSAKDTEGEKRASENGNNEKSLPLDEEVCVSETGNVDNCVQTVQSFSKGNENGSEENRSKAKDFASSVIERLKISTPSPIKDLSSVQDDASCTTPPSTPVVLTTDTLTSPVISFAQSESPAKVDKSNAPDVSEESCGSSVDPPPVSQPFTDNLKSSLETSFPSSEKDIPLNGVKSVVPSTQAMSNNNTVTSCSGVASSVNTVSNLTGPASSEGISEDHKTSSSGSKTDVEKKKPKERDPTKPTFRVTCNRVGEGHAFDSSSAAASLGSSVIKYFGWGVDLKNFDIEVLLNIDNEEVTVGIGLTKSSLHNRNLVAFGPTTLRATICYNMLRLCRIKTGDVVCDPLCGTSALSIEGALNWRDSFHFGGDYHELAMERSVRNATALRKKHEEENRGNLKLGLVQWNLNYFPLRDECVDVFVSDLPFGHRMGSRTINRTLYPTLLSEMARTGRPGARACLLTEDKTSLIKAIQTFGRFWQRRLILSINMGGLSGFVFLLTRTTASYVAPPKEDVSVAERGNAAASARHYKGSASPQSQQTDEASSTSQESPATAKQEEDQQQLSRPSASANESAGHCEEAQQQAPVDNGADDNANSNTAVSSREACDGDHNQASPAADDGAKEIS